MNQTLRSDAEKAIYTAINAVMPEGAVRKALLGKQFPGRVFLVAAGKAAPKMAGRPHRFSLRRLQTA